MKYCKGHQQELDDSQFNGDYNYCQACYFSYKSRHKNKRNQLTQQPTCVYFIKSGDLIKIGFTADLKHRISTMQVNNPLILEVLKTIPGGRIEEQQLHKKFAHLNKIGEWFYATQELLDFIKN